MQVHQMTRLWTMTWLALALVLPLTVGSPAARAQNDEDDAKIKQQFKELKERFKQRYPTLLRLKKEGKVGEQHTGYAGVVKKQYARLPVDPKDEKDKDEDKDAAKDRKPKQTIAEFLKIENADRKKLFTLIAKKLETAVEVVAQREAKRRFQTGEPWEYFKLGADKSWKKKSRIDRERAEAEREKK